MKSVLTVLFLFASFSANGMTKCGSDILIDTIGNVSYGSGGPYIGDLTIYGGGKQFEWRKRYGLDQSLLNQTMSLAIYAKSTGARVDIYCSIADQTYNARYIVVK